jgi:hypothetical protein
MNLTLTAKSSVATHRRPSLVLTLLPWVLGMVYVAAYLVILVPYYGNGVPELSDRNLTHGLFDYYHSNGEPGPTTEEIYGSPELAEFAFTFGGALGPCLFLPLLAMQAYALLHDWTGLSSKSKSLFVSLHVALLIVGIISIVNAPILGSWMEFD